MKRRSGILWLAVGMLLVGSIAQAAERGKILPRLPTLRQPATGGSQQSQPAQEAPPTAEMQAKLAAQTWLKSIGYDLTLERMETLKTLRLQLYSLHHTPLINDAAMVHLKVLPNLETLALPRQIGDAGLANVAGLTKLTTLNMPDCRVTDAGLVYLKGLGQLQSLVISANSNITDVGVAHLGWLPNIEILNLNNSRITDAGVATLGTMRGMRKLFLSRTAITDGAVDHLLNYQVLERLDIQGTNISAAGLARLKSTYPNATINR